MGSIRLAPTKVVAVGRRYLVEGATVYELNRRGTNRMCAHVEGYRDGATDAECAAVAKLFSAAPDMLSVLKWCADNPGECLGDHPKLLKSAIDAVAKAEAG